MAGKPKTVSRVWDVKVAPFALQFVARCFNFLVYHACFLLFHTLLLIITGGLIPILLLNIPSFTNIQLSATALRPLTRIFGISWELRDAVILRKERVGVVVANHQSNLDFIGMTHIWDQIGNCVPTVKKELFYAWPFGLWGMLVGVCYVDRNNPKAAMKALEQESQRSNKTKLWIFPEGTRNRQGQTLLPFKKGAFRLAIAGQVPVLPVVFSPYYFVDEKNCKLRRGGKMVVQALAPIPTRGLTMDDLDDLLSRTRHAMQSAFDTLTEEEMTRERATFSRALQLTSRCIHFLIFHGYFFLYYTLTMIITTGLIPIYLFNMSSVTNILVCATALKPLTRIFGISWELRDAAILRKERVGVVVVNHQSTLDLIGMANIWHKIGKSVPTVKMELFYVWPFGLSVWLVGTCFLDRRNPKAAMKALEKASQRSHGSETKLWIFPEGTRNRQGQTLLPFKKGAFRMAIAGQVPVVPVVYSPYYFVDRKNYKLRRGGKMVVQALAPIPTTGLTMDDLDDLLSRTRHVMQTAFDALTEEVQLSMNAPTS